MQKEAQVIESPSVNAQSVRYSRRCIQLALERNEESRTLDTSTWSMSESCGNRKWMEMLLFYMLFYVMSWRFPSACHGFLRFLLAMPFLRPWACQDSNVGGNKCLHRLQHASITVSNSKEMSQVGKVHQSICGRRFQENSFIYPCDPGRFDVRGMLIVSLLYAWLAMTCMKCLQLSLMGGFQLAVDFWLFIGAP